MHSRYSTVNDYIEALDRQPLGVPFTRPTAALAEFATEQTQYDLNRSEAGGLIRRFERRAGSLESRTGVVLTDEAHELFRNDLNRIRQEFDSKPPEYYSFKNSAFA